MKLLLKTILLVVEIIACAMNAHGAVGVVKVEVNTVSQGRPAIGEGAAVCVGPAENNHWWFLTAKHVIEGVQRPQDVKLVFMAGSPVQCTNWIRNQDNDLAVLIARVDVDLKWACIREELPQVGEKIHVAGFPLGGEYSERDGQWTSEGSRIPCGIIQGDSGGGVFDSSNHLIGIVTSYPADGWEISYANGREVGRRWVPEDRTMCLVVDCRKIRGWYNAQQWYCAPCQPQNQYPAPYQPHPSPQPTPQPNPQPNPQPTPAYVTIEQFDAAINRLESAIANIPQGPEGPQGGQGPPGDRGLPGMNGKDGKDGVGLDHLELVQLSDDSYQFYAVYSNQTTQIVGQFSIPGSELSEADIQNIVNLVQQRVEIPVDIEAIVEQVLQRIDDPYVAPEAERHVVVIGDPEARYYNGLQKDVTTTQTYFDAIELIDPPADRNVGTLPALVLYVNGTPALTKRGTTDVRTQLSRIRRGEFD